MLRLPPRAPLTDTLFPYTPPFRSGGAIPADGAPPLASISETAVKKPSPIVTFVVSASQRLVTPACCATSLGGLRPSNGRSEEHTSELQSLMRISYAVFCLTKKKTYQTTVQHTSTTTTTQHTQ